MRTTSTADAEAVLYCHETMMELPLLTTTHHNDNIIIMDEEEEEDPNQTLLCQIQLWIETSLSVPYLSSTGVFCHKY